MLNVFNDSEGRPLKVGDRVHHVNGNVATVAGPHHSTPDRVALEWDKYGRGSAAPRNLTIIEPAASEHVGDPAPEEILGRIPSTWTITDRGEGVDPRSRFDVQQHLNHDDACAGSFATVAEAARWIAHVAASPA